MKTVLTLLACVAAISAHAVSFAWTSSEQVKFDGTVLGTTGNTAKAYLVYLGTDGGWSFGDDITGTLANITDTSVQDTTTRTSGSPTAKGKITPSSYGLDGNQGFSYGVVLTYKDSSGTTWYNISSDIYTIDPTLADNATDQSHDFSFSFNKGGKVSKLSASNVGGGWTQVPEPSTAMLALAGLALLIKRRRA